MPDAGGLARPQHSSPDSLLSELTPRESQILEGVAGGHSNKEIGRDLDITEKTAKHHMTNVL